MVKDAAALQKDLLMLLCTKQVMKQWVILKWQTQNLEGYHCSDKVMLAYKEALLIIYMAFFYIRIDKQQPSLNLCLLS